MLDAATGVRSLCRPSRFEIGQCLSLAGTVAGLPEDGGGVLVGGDRLLEPPHPLQRHTEVGQRIALAVTVVGLTVDSGSALAGGDRLLELPHLSPRGAEII